MQVVSATVWKRNTQSLALAVGLRIAMLVTAACALLVTLSSFVDDDQEDVRANGLLAATMALLVLTGSLAVARVFLRKGTITVARLVDGMHAVALVILLISVARTTTNAFAVGGNGIVVLLAIIAVVCDIARLRNQGMHAGGILESGKDETEEEEESEPLASTPVRAAEVLALVCAGPLVALCWLPYVS